MKAVIQRVNHASVTIGADTVAQIGPGLLVFLGIAPNDQWVDADRLFQKMIQLRIFSNDDGRFDRSLLDIQGQLLVVSQFTLFAECKKGRRPNFQGAASSESARTLYNDVIRDWSARYAGVQSGQFGADMRVSLVNDGPVTILLDTTEWE